MWIGDKVMDRRSLASQEAMSPNSHPICHCVPYFCSRSSSWTDFEDHEFAFSIKHVSMHFFKCSRIFPQGFHFDVVY